MGQRPWAAPGVLNGHGAVFRFSLAGEYTPLYLFLWPRRRKAGIRLGPRKRRLALRHHDERRRFWQGLGFRHFSPTASFACCTPFPAATATCLSASCYRRRRLALRHHGQWWRPQRRHCLPCFAIGRAQRPSRLRLRFARRQFSAWRPRARPRRRVLRHARVRRRRMVRGRSFA
jgi:hypothetical protein